MRFLVTGLIFFIFFTGCSQKNAFNRFKISKTQELSEDSIQSSKIKENSKITGIVSVVYLNDVYPEQYKDGEYFYIYIYTKKSGAGHIDFRLNGKAPLNTTPLKCDNKFSKLTSFNANWNRYYLVKFAKNTNTLNLKIINNNSSSDAIIFIKDE